MTLGNILAGFEFQDDWEDRYRYVIEPGRSPASAAGRGAHGREQGVGLLQGLARDRRRWHRRGDRASSPLQGRQRRRYRARAYCQLLRDLLGLVRGRDSTDRYAGRVPASRVGRGSDAAALERIRLDGRAHSGRRPARLELRGRGGSEPGSAPTDNDPLALFNLVRNA